MKLPNFLLAGAAKCGTTSMAGYLSQHPDIYMSPIKEPKFFSAQCVDFPLKGPGDGFVENFTVKNFQAYRRLFSRVRHEKAIGDASVDNLYFHPYVIPLIKKYLGNVKVVIMLRNPVDRAFSAYKNLLRDGRETQSFEEGLKRENRRKRQGYEYLWRYLDVGLYFEQVRAYIESFSQVQVIILEKFKKGSLEPARRIFEFLRVDTGFKPNRRKMSNVSGRPRYMCLQRPFNPTPLKGRIYRLLGMHGVNMDTLMRWVETIRDRNLIPVQMNPETRRSLQRIYAQDMEKLEDLLKVDLDVWRTPHVYSEPKLRRKENAFQRTPVIHDAPLAYPSFVAPNLKGTLYQTSTGPRGIPTG